MRLGNLTYVAAVAAVAVAVADLWQPGYQRYGNPLQPVLARFQPRMERWKEQSEQFAVFCDGQVRETPWGVSAEQWAELKRRAALAPRDIQELLGEPVCTLVDGALIYPAAFMDGRIRIEITEAGIRHEIVRDTN